MSKIRLNIKVGNKPKEVVETKPNVLTMDVASVNDPWIAELKQWADDCVFGSMITTKPPKWLFINHKHNEVMVIDDEGSFHLVKAYDEELHKIIYEIHDAVWEFNTSKTVVLKQ